MNDDFKICIILSVNKDIIRRDVMNNENSFAFLNYHNDLM